MRILLVTLALSALPIMEPVQSVDAQEAPQFMKDTFP
jgi:hypothetical protein